MFDVEGGDVIDVIRDYFAEIAYAELDEQFSKENDAAPAHINFTPIRMGNILHAQNHDKFCAENHRCLDKGERSGFEINYEKLEKEYPTKDSLPNPRTLRQAKNQSKQL